MDSQNNESLLERCLFLAIVLGGLYISIIVILFILFEIDVYYNGYNPKL